MDLLDSIGASGYSTGALSGYNAARGNKEAERAKALRSGRSEEEQETLEKKVREVAEDFVSVFMNQITKSMRATVQQNESMHGDNGEKFFQEMLDTEYSKTMARGSGYGLTDLIYQSMMKSYELQREPQPGDAPVPVDSLNETGEKAAEVAAEQMV